MMRTHTSHELLQLTEIGEKETIYGKDVNDGQPFAVLTFVAGGMRYGPAR
jgi:hypothetical protein